MFRFLNVTANPICNFRLSMYVANTCRTLGGVLFGGAEIRFGAMNLTHGRIDRRPTL